MAGGKKKKKPIASNPARGFATTSIASKPKVEASVPEADPTPSKEAKDADDVEQKEQVIATSSVPESATTKKPLTAEEFEKQLEESELQVLVQKHAQKSKREALRQKTRLETDRRVLRSQAESLNTRKWLPPELMEEILDLVKSEGRFAGQSNDVSSSTKQASEEELTIRLWTLQQALIGAGFLEDKVILALRHVLDISDRIGAGNKDAIWGMEESLDWLARECPRMELPDYENWQRKIGFLPKSQTGRCYARFPIYYVEWLTMSLETPIETPLQSGTSTPRLESDTRHMGLTPLNGSSTHINKQRPSPKKVIPIEYDSDIDPDDLLPTNLECRTKLFHLQEPISRKTGPKGNVRSNNSTPKSGRSAADPVTAKLLRKIKRIEDDVLFDQYVATQQWEMRRIQLERDAAARRNAADSVLDNSDSNSQKSETLDDSDDEVSKEAAKIGAALLEENDSDDDAALADLFASLPVNEVDPITGKTSTVVNGLNGVKVTVRDFGKWAGVSPTRVLEEACRARYVLAQSKWHTADF